MFFLVLLFSLNAKAYTWKATVIFPDNEEKTYLLESDKHRFNFQPMTNGTCIISSIEKIADTFLKEVERRFIVCGNEINEVRVPVLVSKQTPENAQWVHIYKNDKLYRISLSGSR